VLVNDMSHRPCPQETVHRDTQRAITAFKNAYPSVCLCVCKNTARVKRLLSQALFIQYTHMSTLKTRWPTHSALLPLSGSNCWNYCKQPTLVISIVSSESGL